MTDYTPRQVAKIIKKTGKTIMLDKILNQIPSEGEYCGLCPCSNFINHNGCSIYPDWLDRVKRKRCAQCLSDKPQILTLEDRHEFRT